jgi:flagellar hook-basal body complex protein FliE
MNEISWKEIGNLGTDNQVGTRTSRSSEENAVSFQKVLGDSLKEVNNLQNQAEMAIQELARGETQDLHRTMVLLEKADLSFKLMMKVRNKLLEAYTEIMRLQA